MDYLISTLNLLFEVWIPKIKEIKSRFMSSEQMREMTREQNERNDPGANWEKWPSINLKLKPIKCKAINFIK